MSTAQTDVVMLLCRETTFSGAARVTRLSYRRVKAVADKYVDAAVAKRDDSKVRDLGLDETTKGGQAYVTIVADAKQHRVLFVVEGRDAETVEAFVKNFCQHGGQPALIENVSMDMSGAFKSSVKEQLGKAEITFDKFHVVAHAPLHEPVHHSPGASIDRLYARQ